MRAVAIIGYGNALVGGGAEGLICPKFYTDNSFLKGGGEDNSPSIPPLDIVRVTSSALRKIEHHHSWTFASTPPPPLDIACVTSGRSAQRGNNFFFYMSSALLLLCPPPPLQNMFRRLWVAMFTAVATVDSWAEGAIVWGPSALAARWRHLHNCDSKHRYY